MQPSAPYGDWQANNYYPGAYLNAPGPAGRRFTLGDLLAIVGGLFVFAFSFAPFVNYPKSVVNRVTGEAGVTFDGWYMAWSAQMFMAPLTWWIIVAALGVIVLAVWRIIVGRDPQVLRFRLSQAQVALSLFALAVLISYAVSHKQVAFGLDDLLTSNDQILENNRSRPVFGWGGYLMIVGAFIAAVGAVLNHFAVGPVMALPTAGAYPQAPAAGWAPTQQQPHVYGSPPVSYQHPYPAPQPEHRPPAG
jgi:hypothetical protein